jgi:predicted membrane-bound spermidine synthase
VAAIVRDRVPIGLGVGVPGLGLGALLVGLVWPYLFGPLGAQLGAIAVALGAVMLVVAGIAALIVDRHVEDVEVV